MGSLQQFKQRVAAAVVTESNAAAGDASLAPALAQLAGTGDTAGAAAEAKAAEAAVAAGGVDGGVVGAMLAALGDLWPERQYSDLQLSAFLSSVGEE